jgi:flagellar motor switch protein FliN/FliY
MAIGDVTFLHDLPLEVVVELGRSHLTVMELAELGADEVIELDRPADRPLDLVVGGRVFARGEVVMIGERLALRITELVGRNDSQSDAEEFAETA